MIITKNLLIQGHEIVCEIVDMKLHVIDLSSDWSITVQVQLISHLLFIAFLTTVELFVRM